MRMWSEQEDFCRDMMFSYVNYSSYWKPKEIGVFFFLLTIEDKNKNKKNGGILQKHQVHNFTCWDINDILEMLWGKFCY